MADTTQQFIDNLITVIWNAEDPESVTNEMVARVFDFLNKGYKDLLTNNSAESRTTGSRRGSATYYRRASARSPDGDANSFRRADGRSH